MSDDLKAEIDKKMEFFDDIREKEEDLLKRQILLCQDAGKDNIQMFVGSVAIFEAMMFEDIRKMEKRKDEYTKYDPDAIVAKFRRAAGLRDNMPTPPDLEYKIALEKFAKLYYIFKEGHMPITAQNAKL